MTLSRSVIEHCRHQLTAAAAAAAAAAVGGGRSGCRQERYWWHRLCVCSVKEASLLVAAYAHG